MKKFDNLNLLSKDKLLLSAYILIEQYGNCSGKKKIKCEECLIGRYLFDGDYYCTAVDAGTHLQDIRRAAYEQALNFIKENVAC